MRPLKELLHCDRGQDLAEYGIALSVIALAVVLIATSLGVDVNSLWSVAEPKLKSVFDGLP